MSCTYCSRMFKPMMAHNEKILLHRFPSDVEIRKIWTKNVRKGDEWSPMNYTTICSLHFEDSCFRVGYNRRILHSHAVPTIFLNKPLSCHQMKASQLSIGGKDYDDTSFAIGLGLAVSSSVFIGSSFIIKKIALKKIQVSGNVRASAGGFAYLKQWMWWLGLITMGIGEAANLLAYAFAPAALVTPLGALSIIVAAVLSSKFINEKLNFLGKIGCFLCIVGSIIFVIHSPKSEEIKTFAGLLDKLFDYLFVTYVAIIIVMSFIIKVVFIPRFGNTNVAVYLLLCSAIGSLTVVSCKAVALGVRETITGEVNNFSNYVFWLLFASAVICIMIQMNYLNKSLDIFNTGIVTPVYYVMFTILVIIASGILFKEWDNMQAQNILGCVCGFLVVMTAVFMLNAFKDFQVSFKDITLNARHRRNTQNLHNVEARDYESSILGVTHIRQS